ncbi:MAG TPA: L,D-transpeptidase family protein [Polyangiaceae bacterium]|nr:L,D-transpeptidase family protein [Polyangiaceae bacterium]
MVNRRSWSPGKLVLSKGRRRLAAALSVVVALAGCFPKPRPDPSPIPTPVPTDTTKANSDGSPKPPIAVVEPAIKPIPPSQPPPPPEEVPSLRHKTTWTSPITNGIERMHEARAAKLDTVRQIFASANVAFPPAQVLYRVFKRDQRLELWASGSKTAPLTHVTTYEVCYASGELGPKRKEGDRQVPEGFYTISFMNPWSAYFLSMQVSYPNASDRILGDKAAPGSDIMIHGNCMSIGCVSMMDERMQEIWVTTIEARKQGGAVHVHIFPARDMTGLIASGQHPQHRAFWENLKEGHDLFAQTKRIPHVAVERDGRYAFR